MKRAIEICRAVERELMSESRYMTPDKAREALANAAGVGMAIRRLEREPSDYRLLVMALDALETIATDEAEPVRAAREVLDLLRKHGA